MQRPTGVTILAVLAIISGIVQFAGALALIGFGGFATGAGAVTAQQSAAAGGALVIIGGLGLLVSAVLILAFGIGAWNLRPWARMLGVIGQGLSLLLAVLSLLGGSNNPGRQLLTILVAGGILYYLYRPHVKRAFRRGQVNGEV